MYNNLYEIRRDTNLIDDKTRILIRRYIPDFGNVDVACGNWYHDNILDFIDDEIQDFKVFPKDNEIIINLGKEVEEILDFENVEESLAAYQHEEEQREEYYEASPLEDWLTDGKDGGALAMLAGYAK